MLSLCELPGNNQDLILLNTLGEVHRVKSEYREAKAVYEQVLRLISQTNASGTHLVVMLNLSEIELALGATDIAQARLDDAGKIAHKLSWKVGFMMWEVAHGAVLLHTQNFSAARAKLEHGFSLDGREIKEFCGERLADPSLWSAETYTAAWAYIFLAQISTGGESHQQLPLFQALQFLGITILRADGDVASAAALLSVALEGFTRLDIHRSVAECSLELADILAVSGEPQDALEYLDRAQKGFDASAQTNRVARIDAKRKAMLK